MGEQNKSKHDMMAQLAALDVKADTKGLSMDEWEARYNIEDNLEKILSILRRSSGNINVGEPW